MSEMTPDEAQELLEADDYPDIQDALDRALTTIADMEEEWGVVDKWGDVVWFTPADYVNVSHKEARQMAVDYAATDDMLRLVIRFVTNYEAIGNV